MHNEMEIISNVISKVNINWVRTIVHETSNYQTIKYKCFMKSVDLGFYGKLKNCSKICELYYNNLAFWSIFKLNIIFLNPLAFVPFFNIFLFNFGSLKYCFTKTKKWRIFNWLIYYYLGLCNTCSHCNKQWMLLKQDLNEISYLFQV